MTVRRFLLATVFAATALALQPSTAAAEFTGKQKDEIGTVVREYLIKNPEVLMEALDALRAKQAQAAHAQQAEALKRLAGATGGAMTPIVGAAKGDVTVIEFFDYQCSYCKKAFPNLRAAMKGDGNIRVAMKEFPILGPASEVAARAALAVWKLAPEKYMDFHARLMDVKGRLSENKVIVTATEMGVKEADLRKAMLDPAVTRELRENAELAQTLNITGTPAFIIGDQVFPGYLEVAELKKQIAAARARAAK